MSEPVRLLLVGAGRMGRAILEAASGEATVAVGGVLDRRPPDVPLPGNPAFFPDLQSALDALSPCVVLDFSSAEGAADRVRAAGRSRNALVLGTTGLGAEVEAALIEAAATAAMVVAPNASAGVSLLRRALRAALPPPALGWDAGLLERHHRGKRDAPSGTAKLLAEDLRRMGWDRVEIVSLRQGGVIGEHSVHLAGPDEELVLVHRALSRSVFARGALLAARFAAAASPGCYGMDDVLAASD